MDRNFIPCCYHPTTVVMIDDDARFLKFASLKIESNNNLVTKTFADPISAADFLIKQYKPKTFLEFCLDNPEEQSRDHRNIDFDIRAIRQELYNPYRFDEIFIVVVDYVMPNMNGLELCKQLQHRYVKKILLTGEADEKIAIDGFNKGLIHKFIRKDMPDALEQLNQAIQELLWKSFQEQSEVIVNTLSFHPEHPPSCLDDPIFVDFFEQLCKKYKFTEYYLMDANGSFMFLDVNAKPSWLVVKDEGEMRGWHEMAELADTEVSPSILQAMQTRQKILYLHSDSDFQLDPSQWQKYLHTASKLEGRITYYYSYIDNSNTYDINTNKILSYKKYLDQL